MYLLRQHAKCGLSAAVLKPCPPAHAASAAASAAPEQRLCQRVAAASKANPHGQAGARDAAAVALHREIQAQICMTAHTASWVQALRLTCVRDW